MNIRKRTPYRVCPDCGSHLDPGEPCDCKRQRQLDAEAAARRGQLENYRETMLKKLMGGSYH